MLCKTVVGVASAMAVASATDLPSFTNSVVHGPRNTDEQLAFVFELVRHGARAPIENRDIDEFPVGEGLLTPEGMRQRYLLGRHNRERYIDQYKLISDVYDPREVYMQSTNVNRTMQSGYSELLGLFPPGNADTLTEAMKVNLKNGIAMPAFNVRDADRINESLGDDALPNGYVQIPIKEFNNHDIHDDVATDGCAFINNVGSKRENDPSIWAQFKWMQEQTQGPLEEALDVTQDYVDSLSNWHDYQVMTDTAVALDFEGHPEHETYFSDDQWELINEYQKVWLTDDYSKDASDLMMSRILRKPVTQMKHTIDTMLGKTNKTEDPMKFMIYSAHDTQVVNMMDFLKKDFDWVPYASTVIFELKYQESCLKLGGAEECFGVSVIFNGRPQLFEGCTGDLFTLEGCKWTEFEAYLKTIWYSGPSADNLNTACATPVV